MNKIKILKKVNFFLLIFFISQAVSGVGHKNIDHEIFEFIHYKGAYILIFLALMHLVLNWDWIRNNYFKR